MDVKPGPLGHDRKSTFWQHATWGARVRGVAIERFPTRLARAFEAQSAAKNPVTQYLYSLESEGSRLTMYRALAAVLRIVHDRAEISATDILAYDWQRLGPDSINKIKNTTLHTDGKAPSTTNVRIAAIRGVQRFAQLTGQMDTNLFLQVKNGVRYVQFDAEPAGRYLEPHEVEALLESCGDTLQGVRDRAIITAMVRAGLRRSEIIGLSKHAYLSSEGVIQVLGKRRKERKAVLLSSGDNALKAWLQLREKGPGLHMFCPIEQRRTQLERGLSSGAVYALLERRASQVGLGQVRPHDLRRTYATFLFLHGVDLNHVRLSMGHDDADTTLRYDVRPKQKMIEDIRRVRP